MENKLYGGEVTLQVFTTVEANDDLVQERNEAHKNLDFDLFAELRKLVEEKGYHVSIVAADLHYVEDADKSDVDFISNEKIESKNRSKKRSFRIQL
ncbi:hypothetical protein ACTHOQ_18440 [Solibacillus silvestris]|uniref:hypothetical protein n=1 Tax=Solibacillus TaxID=648800 RepID=UPI0030FC08E1